MAGGVQSAQGLHAAGRAGGRHQRLDTCQGFGIRERGGNPVLFVHALGVAQQEPICQVQVVCKRQGAGERAEGLGVVVLGVSAPGAVRAQPGAVADGDAGIACGPAGETAGAPRAAASGRCVHPAPIRRAGQAECPGTGPG